MHTEQRGMKTKRILMTVFGVCICGISVGFFSYSNLGVDPFQVLAHGLWSLTSISFGLFYALINMVLLVVAFLTNRHMIGLGTLINLFLFGYIAEGAENILKMLNPSPSVLVRYLCLLFAIIVMCLASALYFTADLGVSTYDSIALTIDERTSDRIQFRYIRIACDLVCVIIGGVFGGTIGIGTLITAFFMGPLITFFNNTVAKPLLYKKHPTENI